MEVSLNGLQILLILAGSFASWQVGWYHRRVIKWVSNLRFRSTPTHLVIEQKPLKQEDVIDIDDIWTPNEIRVRDEIDRLVYGHDEPDLVLSYQQAVRFEKAAAKELNRKWHLRALEYAEGQKKELYDVKQYADNLKYLNLEET